MEDNVRNLARFGHTLIITTTFLTKEPQTVHYSGEIYYRRNEESGPTWVGSVESNISKEDLVKKAEERCKTKKTPATLRS